MEQRYKFIIAVIITITICSSILIAFANSIINNVSITDQGRNILGNTISALLAIVSMIIGANVLKDK